MASASEDRVRLRGKAVGEGNIDHWRPTSTQSSAAIDFTGRAAMMSVVIARVEAFSEPAVDRSKQIVGLLAFTLIVPEPC
jgi:hypothetical protein